MQYKFIICGLLLAGLAPDIASATCNRVTAISALSQAARDAGYTASSWTGTTDGQVQGKLGLPGVITLSNGTGFQPEGTLLGSASATFVPSARTAGYTANQILFKCDISDLGSLYEFYATNGDDARGGMNVVPGIEQAYYTYVKNVAVRLTNLKTGEYYSRYWQSRAIPESDVFNDGSNIYVPASAFSDVFVELFRVDDASMGTNGDNRYAYGYAGPAGYIAFQGGGYSDRLADGEDSRYNYDGWYTEWAGGWSLTNQTVFVRGAACRISDYPAIVTLPSITVAELSSGNTSQAGFSVNVECESGAKSGTSASTTSNAWVAMGFLVNNATAASVAAGMGLTTSAGAYTWLLDNHYGASGVASGVGIRIYSDKLSGQALNLLPNLTATATGNNGGWYGYQQLTDASSSVGSIYTWTGDFTASLEAIPGKTVTSGSVYAQLQVVVSFQ
ncbi:fimbrial usher protein StbD [Entomohabitans teleogrylli]|uniref:fimbrial usher protein StbD n=1 Tax=Entomohabitans teleogrylli TaxID=1384589 RepID=UPI00073DACEF|nr:fimbrial usher protein StbD [Entomohabitans teleogrylli]